MWEAICLAMGDWAARRSDSFRKSRCSNKSPCCPGMYVGYISNVPAMIYAYTEGDVYVNQYIGSTAKIPLAGGILTLKQEADWAWSGNAKLTVVSGSGTLGSLRLRLPRWSANTEIAVNGQAVSYVTHNGYAVLSDNLDIIL